MAGIQFLDGTNWKGDSDDGSGRVNIVARGNGYSVGAVTGIIGAALAANASVFGMRLDPASPVRAYIDRIRLDWTTLVAFTTPITAARQLAIWRGSGAATSGGTAITTATLKHSTSSPSEFDVAQGGDLRIATTGALTVTGITFEAQPIQRMTLSHVGAAGAYYERTFEFHATESMEIVLEPGQILTIRNPILMDAAGTWQLGVNVQWREAALLSA